MDKFKKDWSKSKMKISNLLNPTSQAPSTPTSQTSVNTNQPSGNSSEANPEAEVDLYSASPPRSSNPVNTNQPSSNPSEVNSSEPATDNVVPTLSEPPLSSEIGPGKKKYEGDSDLVEQSDKKIKVEDSSSKPDSASEKSSSLDFVLEKQNTEPTDLFDLDGGNGS